MWGLHGTSHGKACEERVGALEALVFGQAKAASLAHEQLKTRIRVLGDVNKQEWRRPLSNGTVHCSAAFA